jgi:hypothetical protein
MSMERALRSITSPRKAAAGPVGPQKSTMKKGRKRDERGNEENVKGKLDNDTSIAVFL